MQNKDLLLYFESFLSIINKRNPTNIVGYERKVESMSNINISYKELKQLEKGSYQLLDMRDESNTSYGMIPGAVVAAGEDELGTQAKEYIDQGKKVILYCTKGIFSKEAAEKLAEEGIDVLSLEGGYTGWLLSLMKEEQENDQKTEQNNKEAEGKGKKKETRQTGPGRQKTPSERGGRIPGAGGHDGFPLVCRRRQASSFTSSMTTAVSGMKKMMPRMPKRLPPIMAAIRV